MGRKKGKDREGVGGSKRQVEVERRESESFREKGR